MLLRVLKHPDIVEIKHILLPPQPREFRDIYIVFELMETVRRDRVMGRGCVCRL